MNEQTDKTPQFGLLYSKQLQTCFKSKVIERAVAFHLNKYLINNNLNELLQSAYKSDHSTETTLVRVKNYIMMSIN